MRRQLLAGIVAGALLTHAARAQRATLSALPAGATVRLTYRPVATDSGALVPPPVVGRFVGLDTRSLYVIPSADTARGAYALDALQRVEYVSSRRHPRLQYSVVGGVAGTVIGALVGIVRTPPDVTYCNMAGCPPTQIHPPRVTGVRGAIVGGSAGLALGFITGSIASINRWTRLELR